MNPLPPDHNTILIYCILFSASWSFSWSSCRSQHSPLNYWKRLRIDKLLQRCTTFFVCLATPRVCHLLGKQPQPKVLSSASLMLYFQYEPITTYGILIHCSASNYRPSFVTTSVTKDVTVYTASVNSAYSYCRVVHVCVSSNSPNFRRNLLICLFIKLNRSCHWISSTRRIFHDSDKAAMWTAEMGGTLAPLRLGSWKFMGLEM
jgi:hypothetical protein